MRSLTTIVFLILTIHVFGQTKADLINAIKKMNILENDDKGMIIVDEREHVAAKITLPSEVDNFENFRALISLIDTTELLKLGSDDNPIIRMFAIRELFHQKNKVFDFKQAFMKELKSRVVIKDREGCEIARSYTYSILFYDLSGNWNSASFLKQKSDFDFVDNILGKIDSYCLSSNVDLPEDIFETIFGRRKFGVKHLNRIKELIYSEDNFYAFKFLMENYPSDFEKAKAIYLKDNFLNKKFDIKKRPYSFYEFLKYSIQTSNKELELNLLKQYNRLDNKKNFEWIMNRIKVGY
jgi:hypothetical protein